HHRVPGRALKRQQCRTARRIVSSKCPRSRPSLLGVRDARNRSMARFLAIAAVALTACGHGRGAARGAEAIVDAIVIATIIAAEAQPPPQVWCDDGTTVDPPHTCPGTSSPPPPPPED